MNATNPFFGEFIQAVAIEPFLYFEIIRETNIPANQETKLDIIIHGVKGTKIEIKLNNRNVSTLVNFVNLVLDKNKKPIVMADAKIFQTFCKKFNSNGINFNLIYDILWYRKYTGNKDEYNFQSFKEICETFKTFITSNIISTYKSIFQKLICISIPEIENQFLVDDNTAEKIFPNYIIEGQDNGRLNTKTYGTKSYNPNTIDEEKRISLINPYEDEAFVYFDYRSMEASVLAGLAKDSNLSTVVNSNNDPYEQIAKYVLGIDETNSRSMGKDIFLPVIYGISSQTLADKMGISLEITRGYIKSLRSNFSASFGYMDEAYRKAESDGKVADYFGRVRFFNSNDAFKAKNFVIQSPSATINQIILNRLIENSSKIGYRVFYMNHDAYCLSVKRHEIKDKFYKIKELLEQKIEQAPDVLLFAEGKVGRKLNEMTKITKSS